jgi:hypothetical protein
MSKTASIGLAPSATLFGRLMASIDRLLMTSARVAVRNGDLPISGFEPANPAFVRSLLSLWPDRLKSYFRRMAPVFGAIFLRACRSPRQPRSICDILRMFATGAD